MNRDEIALNKAAAIVNRVSQHKVTQRKTFTIDTTDCEVDRKRMTLYVEDTDLSGDIISSTKAEGVAIRIVIEGKLGLMEGDLLSIDNPETIRLIKFHTQFTKMVQEKKRQKNLSVNGTKYEYKSINGNKMMVFSNTGMEGKITPRRIMAALAPSIVEHIKREGDLPVLLSRGLRWSDEAVRNAFKVPINLALLVDGVVNGVDWDDEREEVLADISGAYGITVCEFYKSGMKSLNAIQKDVVNSAERSADRKFRKFIINRNLTLDIDMAIECISCVKLNTITQERVVLELERLERLRIIQNRL